MTIYSIKDAVMDMYEEHAKIKEAWVDPVSEKYQEMMAVYEKEMKKIEKLLSEASYDLEDLKKLYHDLEAEDAFYEKSLRMRR